MSVLFRHLDSSFFPWKLLFLYRSLTTNLSKRSDIRIPWHHQYLIMLKSF